ncbi:hypothetical protein S40293_01717 [Stachybotrys chartarum IBT 40293]|nr:hypothetical protein S40293_01717 [Stachybotrys chartarum IBT 40293]
MARSTFPTSKGTDAFWRTEVGHLDEHRTTPDLPQEAGIVVIGAGFASASFLTHLLRDVDRTSSSIVVVEARQLCSGATGRNGGHLKPDSYHKIASVARDYGFGAASELATFEAQNLDAVSQYVIENNVDCDLIMTRAIDVQLTDKMRRSVREGYSLVTEAGMAAIRGTFAIPEQYAEKVSGVKGAKSAYSYSAAHLWPYKLIQHMFADAIAKGVNLQTMTPVKSVSDTPSLDGHWTVHTDRGAIRARKVIVATNAYTAAILPEYRDKIIPYKGVSCRIAAPPGKAPLLNNTYALRFDDWDFDYLIPRPDGSIVVGGARQRYYHDLENWYNNADDSTLIDDASGYFDGYMQRHFAGWANSDARVTHLWTGILGYSADRLPRVGAIPNRPGMFIMAGFTGHGMPQVFLTAKGVAGMVAEGTAFAQTGVPRIFEETVQRLESTRNDILDTWKSSQAQTKL